MAQMFFSEADAASIAQTMEENGLNFYQKAAGAAESPKIREVFLRLADDEKKHLATFKELEATLRARQSDPLAAGEEDIGPYVKRLMQSQVFCEERAAARLAAEAYDDMEALAAGMQAERDSILFYQEMLDFVDSHEARDAFAWILKEERKHLETLAARAEDCAT
jgi:rubrerythrin